MRKICKFSALFKTLNGVLVSSKKFDFCKNRNIEGIIFNDFSKKVDALRQTGQADKQ